MDATTKKMIETYYQEPEPTAFFTGMFRSRPDNFFGSEKVAIDIQRGGEDVAIVLQDLSVGYRWNSDDRYTSKEFAPPIFKEAFPLNAFDLIKRMPGQNPFESSNFRANLITRFFRTMRKLEAKIRRAIELQASQIIQTGEVTLTDMDGNALYELSYSPKATHFPTAGTSWATATGAQMLADLEALAKVVRTDGLSRPDQIIFGGNAWNKFINNADILERFNYRRVDQGTVARAEMRGEGGTYHGTITIGNYNFDLWTYDATYKDPETLTTTEYLKPGTVIVRDSGARMDASFGAIPNFNAILGGGAGSLIPELPSRMNSAANGMDLSTNIWKSVDGEQLFGGVGSRPLMIPVAIDSFGALDTQL